jgi:uncharacterized membrane protein
MGYINDLKEQALATLRGKWGSFVGLTFIYILLYVLASFMPQYGTIFMGSSFKTLAVVMTIIGGIVCILFVPMQYGYYIAHLNASRQDLPADIGDLFCGYRRFADVFVTLLLQFLAIFAALLPYIIFYIVMIVKGLFFTHTFLNSTIAILLMIPGLILGLAYTLVPFILHDRPELNPISVLRESRMMMYGHKWELFLLILSFFGWLILALFTFGIGLLWLAPYMSMTIVKFYEQLRAEYEGTGDEETPLQEEVTPAEEMQPAPAEESAPAAEPVPETEEPADVTE